MADISRRALFGLFGAAACAPLIPAVAAPKVTVGFDLAAAGMCDELWIITRDAFAPRLVAQLYNQSPLMRNLVRFAA